MENGGRCPVGESTLDGEPEPPSLSPVASPPPPPLRRVKPDDMSLYAVSKIPGGIGVGQIDGGSRDTVGCASKWFKTGSRA